MPLKSLMKKQKVKSHRSSPHVSPSGSVGEVRLIGGDFRGRKLPVLMAQGLRPTSDRVRETLFNWLQFEVPGAKCLDVFAGSGALGFEALSRGAERVTFLELDGRNARQLKQNIEMLKVGNAEVVETNSLTWLDRPASAPFDLVFLDPPFHQDLMQPALDRLFAQGYLTQTSWLYLEQEKTLDWPAFPPGWVCHREKKTSQVRFGLWRLEAD